MQLKGKLLTLLALTSTSALAKPVPYETSVTPLEERNGACQASPPPGLFRFAGCQMKRVSLAAAAAQTKFTADQVWTAINDLWTGVVRASYSSDPVLTAVNAGNPLLAGNPAFQVTLILRDTQYATNWDEFVTYLGGNKAWNAILLAATDFADTGKARAFYAVAKDDANTAVASMYFSIFEGITQH